MSAWTEFGKKIRENIRDMEILSTHECVSAIKIADLEEILMLAKQDFPRKEEAKIMGSDGEEHTYETYDTEAIDRWFLAWFGE